MPNSLTKVLWDIVILVVLFINIFYIPMKIAFNVDDMLNSYY